MIETISIERWQDADRAHPAPTFFARPAWTLALCDASPQLRPAPLLVRVGERAFLVPAVRSPARLGMRDLFAFPMGAYTCVLDENGTPADAQTCALVIASIARTSDRTRIVCWPLAEQPVVPEAQRTEYETAVIDCSQGFDSAAAGIRGVTRRMAGQAERRGVQLRRAPGDETSVEAYYSILKEASKGWGLDRPPISEELLKAVVRRGADDVEIWFAEIDSKPIAGGVVLFGREELFFWSAAMLRTHSQYRPSNALNLRLLRAACDRGVRWYNLGASEGLAGVERFKSDLGATAKTYAVFTTQSRKFHVYDRLVRAFRKVEVA